MKILIKVLKLIFKRSNDLLQRCCQDDVKMKSPKSKQAELAELFSMVRRPLEGYIDLSKNENQYGPSDDCMAVLKMYRKEDLLRYSRGEMEVLKEKLSKYLNVDPSSVLVANGGVEIVRELFRSVKRITLPEESWSYYWQVCKKSDIPYASYRIWTPHAYWHYDGTTIVDAVMKEKGKNPQILLICSPNNPTGNQIENDVLNEVLEKVSDSILVVLDEVYTEFTGNRRGHLDLLRDHENLIILRSFSKYFALAGLRLGYLVCNEKVMKRVGFFDYSETFQEPFYLRIEVIKQMVAAAAFTKDSQKYYEEKSENIKQDRKKLLRILEAFKDEGWCAYDSEANFVLVYTPKHKTELAESMKRHRIKIKSVLSSPYLRKDLFKSYVRISIGTSEQMKTLANALNELRVNGPRHST